MNIASKRVAVNEVSMQTLATASKVPVMKNGAVSLTALRQQVEEAGGQSDASRPHFVNIMREMNPQLKLAGGAACAPAATEPVPAGLYGPEGTLDVAMMKELLLGVKSALQTLSPNAVKAASLIDKTLNATQLKDSPKLYGSLKDISQAIAGADGSESMQRLAGAVMQMARTHNYQAGVGEYDQSAKTATARYLEKNPTLETRSNAFHQHTLKFGGGGGPKWGVAMGALEGGAVDLKVDVNLSKTNMLLHDFDRDNLYIKKGQGALSVLVLAALGKVCNIFSAGKVSGGIDMKGLRGCLFDGKKAEDVVGYSMMHEREGGGSFSPALNPGKKKLTKLANLSTRGMSGMLNRFVNSATSRLWSGPAGDRQVSLNTHKLIKGGVPELFLVKDNSLLKGIAACRSLQEQLDQAYGNLPRRELPDSLKPIVGDASWYEYEGSAALSGNLLELGSADTEATSSLVEVAGSQVFSHRSLPFKLWMAPHAVLQVLSDGDDVTRRELLDQVRTADASVSGYLDKIEREGVSQLQRDMDTFESLAHTLLSAQGVIRGGDSSALLKTHARHHFGRDLKTLSDTFLLQPEELKGLAVNSDRLELTLARCWNRLSLGHAQASLIPGDTTRVALERLDQQIKAPNVLMAPTYLYHGASLQMETTLKRWRSNTAFSVALPSLSLGSGPTVQAGLASAGSLNFAVTYDKVSQHSNLVRNGKFATFNVAATHLPAMGCMDTLARFIAIKIAEQVQKDGDRKPMTEYEHAAFVASMTSTLATGLVAPAAGALGVSAGISRQFEVGMHRSDKGEPWRLCYFQASNVENRSMGIDGQIGFAAGAGGSVGLRAGLSSAVNVVRPPILGSAPSFHVLQLQCFTDALCSTPDGALDSEKVVFDTLRNQDVASMYFSNDAILDQLQWMQALKQDRQAPADVLGRLVRLDHNDKQYDTFARSGLNAQVLDRYLREACEATQGATMEKRLEYFTTHEQGRALLQEYAKGMVQLAAMKGRATFLRGEAHGGALNGSIVDAKGQKHALLLPASLTRF
ncbi:hypothetical protein HDC30_002418 [Pseudomonas sp. JAI115]|uniref:hypothetical protein n=1 Tax=Pseudomonas sp. JAI115 TaxID=2723061 RepID=UPI00160813A2|nr:hypothetical protein [Pseudomonas sp. JAI115]MBB6155195.1 hypothetical protein [Pseudomonas sp. JAI115]